MASDLSFFKDNLARMIYSISHDGQNQSSYARRRSFFLKGEINGWKP